MAFIRISCVQRHVRTTARFVLYSSQCYDLVCAGHVQVTVVVVLQLVYPLYHGRRALSITRPLRRRSDALRAGWL